MGWRFGPWTGLSLMIVRPSLPFDPEGLLGHGDGNEALRHVAGEWDRHPQHRPHGGKPRPFEEPAPVVLGHATENFPIGLYGSLANSSKNSRPFQSVVISHAPSDLEQE